MKKQSPVKLKETKKTSIYTNMVFAPVKIQKTYDGVDAEE